MSFRGVPDELGIVFESFDRNARVTRKLLETLDMNVLLYDDGMGGFNIGNHLADIVSFRKDWLERVSPKHAQQVESVIDESKPTWLGMESIAQLQQGFDSGDRALREAVLSAVTEGRKFKGYYESHPAHLMQHCIVHDSHHRGQILALLRQSGRSADQREQLEKATWPIWRE